MNKVMIFIATLGFSASAVAAVPNTFSAGNPANAADVNENFENLDARVVSLESNPGGSQNCCSGNFALEFSAEGDPKNVIVLVQNKANGDTQYHVRSRYANSTEQVSVNGTPTVRPFIANYAVVVTDSNAVITSITNSIEAPDTENYINFDIEESTYDISSLAKTVTNDTVREEWKCASSGGNANLQCLLTGKLSASGAHLYTGDWGRVQNVVTGAITLPSGLTISEDQRLENYTSIFYSFDQFRIRARGIGMVYRLVRNSDGETRERSAIYYQSNGVTGGSLTGTPFAPGQPLDGLFF